MSSFFPFLLLGFLHLNAVASELDIGDEPLVLDLVPVGSPLDLHVLLRRDELVNDEVLEPDFPGQLPDSVHQVLPLPLDLLLDVVQFTFLLLVLDVNFVDFLGFRFKLIFLT